MDKENNNNLTISGIGSSNGGTVRLAKIEGIGKIDGDVNCINFNLNGKADVHGSVKAVAAWFNGTAAIEGVLRADNLHIQGKIIVGGDMISENIQINGMASVKGSCETEKFVANGRLRMGALHAGNVQIRLEGNSSIAEICGEHIRIHKQPGLGFAKWLKVLPIPLGNNLTAEIIEGDDVYVEYTTAAVVRGANISIGPGCEIEWVEYKTKFDLDKGSKVKRLEQS